MHITQYLQQSVFNKIAIGSSLIFSSLVILWVGYKPTRYKIVVILHYLGSGVSTDALTTKLSSLGASTTVG
jgi:hypothetical protein